MVTQRLRDPETESFAGLLLRYRGRTGLTQRDLAARLGTSRRSIQDWESGAYHPNAERLQALILVLLESGGLTAGRELVEAHELWAAALREAPRMQTPLDRAWLDRVLAERAAPRTNLTRAVNAPEPASGWQARSASCLPTTWCHRRASPRGWRRYSSSCEIDAACCCSTTLRRCSSQVSRRDAIEMALAATARCCEQWARQRIRAA